VQTVVAGFAGEFCTPIPVTLFSLGTLPSALCVQSAVTSVFLGCLHFLSHSGQSLVLLLSASSVFFWVRFFDVVLELKPCFPGTMCCSLLFTGARIPPLCSERSRAPHPRWPGGFSESVLYRVLSLTLSPLPRATFYPGYPLCGSVLG